MNKLHSAAQEMLSVLEQIADRAIHRITIMDEPTITICGFCNADMDEEAHKPGCLMPQILAVIAIAK